MTVSGCPLDLYARKVVARAFPLKADSQTTQNALTAMAWHGVNGRLGACSTRIVRLPLSVFIIMLAVLSAR